MAHDSDKNKSVLYLVDKSGFGGVQTIAYTLIELGVSPDIEMFFFFLRNINDHFKMEDITQPNVRYSKATCRYSLRPFFDVFGLIRKQNVDILHLNGNKSVILGVLLKILFFRRLRLVAHEHGGVFDYTSWYPLFLKLSRRWIDLFVTVSNYRMKFLVSRSYIDPGKVRVLNNFVNPLRLGLSDAQKAERHDRVDGSYVIGYVGGLSWIKGCDVLIRAFGLVKETIPNVRLVIAGDGPARDELGELAESLNVKDQTSFLGFVEKPGATYAGFDLMVIPSRSEEGPISLYEAWAMGVPVVASSAPVLNERIRDGETGIFFRSENHVDLAEKILQVYRDSALTTRIIKAGAQEADNLSVELYQNSLRDLYVSL